MICAKCGATNPSESAYCGGCGSFLAPEPAAAASDMPAQAPATPAPVEGAAAPAEMPGEEMPTFHTMQPVASEGQESPATAIEDVPTIRAAAAQPTPASGEFVNNVPLANPQALPGWPAQPSGPLPAPQPWYPGALYPQQGVAPGYPGALYPQQGQPGVPGFPSGAQFPPVAPQPTPLPGYPQATPLPGYPQATPLPGFPPVQGQPSGEFPAGAFPLPGQPSGEFPAGAFPLPGQPVSGAWGAYGAPGGIPTTPQAPAAPSKLISPLPLWAFIGGIVVVAVVLLLLTFFSGTDTISSSVQIHPGWAAGAQIAGIVALILGVLLLIAFGVRSALGLLALTNPHRRRQMLSSLLLTLLLIAVGAVGLTAQAGIHSAQGRSLEAQHDWQNAIYEYQAGGQGTPSSEDIARTYVGWGDQLVQTGHYTDGIAKFDIVTTNYNLAANGFALAKSHAIKAYTDWANLAMQAQKYSDATQRYDKLLAETYCDSTCQAQTGGNDAIAYDKLAEQYLNQQPPDYDKAVAAFNTLTSKFGSSSSSKSAHADYARALWGSAQAHVNDPKTCTTSALPLYQQLSSQFSDTPQGQQAATALAQPAPVSGHFTTTIPSGSEAPLVGLVQGVSPGMSSNAFYAILNKSPVTTVNSDGTFLFKPVKQGTYDLVWGTANQSKGQIVFRVSQRYPAAVGPVCGFSFGDINETFPLA